MATYKGKNYTFVPALSFAGDVPTGGFESEFVQCAGYATMLVAYYGDFGSTINIYESNVRDNAGRVQVFTKTLTADTKFLKRFQLSSTFIQIEIVNDAEEVDKKLFLEGSFSSTTQFQTQKLLNSKINIDDNLEIKKVVNDFYDDVIRGGFESYEKITINGILRASPSGVVTIGLDDDYRYNEQFSFANITVQSTNDNYPAGTGARVIKIAGVLGSGEEFTQNVNLVTGTSSLGLAIMSIHHMEVIEAGTLHQNDGDITIYGAGGDVLGFMEATRNRALNSYYKVPLNKCLVMKEIHVFGNNHGGTLKFMEYNPTTDIEYTFGEFIIEQTDIEITVPLHKKIEALNVLKVNYDPTGGGTGTQFKVNINGNGILYPIPNTF